MIQTTRNITRNTVRFCLQSSWQHKNSTVKPKTIWNIVKTITNNKNMINTVSTMNVNDKLSSNPLPIANAFNSYFSSVAENLLIRNFSVKNTTNNNDPRTYL